MSMMNKKAILMEETLKIIIAVVCIIALLYLAFSMYGIFTQKKAIEQARATISNVIDKAAVLKDGESFLYLVESPKKYYLAVFNRESTPRMPSQCLKEATCLCMCEEESVEDCDASRTCKDSPTMLAKNAEIYTKEIPLGVYLRNIGGVVELTLS